MYADLTRTFEVRGSFPIDYRLKKNIISLVSKKKYDSGEAMKKK